MQKWTIMSRSLIIVILFICIGAIQGVGLGEPPPVDFGVDEVFTEAHCDPIPSARGRIQLNHILPKHEPLNGFFSPQTPFTAEHNGWQFYLSVCQPFSMPKDPHQGRGDHCYHANICMSQSSGTGIVYYMLGIDKDHTVREPTERERSQKITAVLQFHGQRTFRDAMTEVFLKCSSESSQGLHVKPRSDNQAERSNDESPYNTHREKRSSSKTPSDEKDANMKDNTFLRKLLSIGVVDSEKNNGSGNNSSRKNRKKTSTAVPSDATKQNLKLQRKTELRQAGSVDFELWHPCACYNACQDDAPLIGPGMILEDTVTEAVKINDTLQSNKTDVAQDAVDPSLHQHEMYIILVVNIGLIGIAVTIGVLCCRTGGVRGPYLSLPVSGHKLRGSSVSLDSVEKTVLRSGGERLDYSSSMHQLSALPMLDNILIPQDKLTIGYRIGGGRFSDTYKAQWSDRHVAAKRLTAGVHQGQLSQRDLKWLTQQIVMLSRLRHANITGVIGFYICERSQPHVITDFVEGDALRELLRAEDVLPPWSSRLKVVIQAAEGMYYLHSQTPAVLHRDLRSANILVSVREQRDLSVKIVDFGMTKLVQHLRMGCEKTNCFCQPEFSALPASVRWTAPEILDNAGVDHSDTRIFSTKCDVYSFSMLLWEVATATDPFEEADDEQLVSEIVLEGGRPSLDDWDILLEYRQLMRMCWSHDPSHRPAFKQIVSHLKSILTSAQKKEKQQKKHADKEDRSTTTYLLSTLHASSSSRL